MNIEIRKISYEEYLQLKELSREQVDFGKTKNPTYYIGAFVDNKLIGAVGYMMIGNNLRYKSDGVLPEYRKMGVYTKLWNEREKMFSNFKSGYITAYCTKKSLGMYVANGFEVGETNKNGVTYVKKYIK